jgi:predicted secreted protein
MLGCVMAMMLVFSAVTLPDDPSQANATVGKDYLLFVNTGTAYVPVWTLVGGQRSASLGRTTDEIDTSCKTSGGYKSAISGLRGWSIDLDGLLLLQDNGIAAFDRAYEQGKSVNIKLLYPDSTFRVGWATLTDYSNEAPHDGEASLSGTLSGQSPLSVLAQKFSIATTETITAYFDAKATATGVTLAGTEVEAASFTATTKGQILFSNTYLKTLTAGEYIFYVELSIGGYALIPVIVTA